ncbi:MAG: hypothetical protein K8F91_01995 [Candidatus Obscuribacterales bacterium]|nr:hypothetical protein [Candidatus Obscuribacterales bacterium]
MLPRKSFLLRIDPKIYNDLESWAQQEMRSVNGQIEYILRQAVLKYKGKETINITPVRMEAQEKTDQID